MILLRDRSPLPPSCESAVVALGNFDGLHLGHRAIIEATIAKARASGKPAGVITFEPHPRRVFKPELPPLKIFPFREKLRLLSQLGIHFIRVVRFTRAFSRTTAEEFITQFLHTQLRVSHVVTGEDFIFGHNRTGNAAYLREKGSTFGLTTTACAPVLLGGERCSSTRVRSLLTEGNMAATAALLARPYSITGKIREGDKRGRTLGFPTANILPVGIFLPASGVYAVRTVVDGTQVNGVANLGSRPTFGGTEMRLETHLLDWQGNLYGKRLQIEFIERIRSEKKFENLEALTHQIAEDCQQARRLLSQS